MEIIKSNVGYQSKSTTFHIYPIGDIHLGNAGCDIKKLLEKINEIKQDKFAYWIGMGDMVECINIDDKRFDPRSIDPSYNIKSLSRLIDIQIDDITSYLKPIANKCLGFLSGNHEEQARLRYHRDVPYDICKKLNILDKLLSYDGFIRVVFKRGLGSQQYTFYVSHGFGASRKSGAKVNRLEDVAHSFDADIIILAHEHKKVIAPPLLKLGLDKIGELEQKLQYACMSGSFLRGYVEKATSYVEKAGYPPTDLGTICISINPFHNRINITL